MLVCCVLLFFDCLETLVLGHAKTLIKLIFSDGALLTLEGARLTHAWEMNIFGNLTLLIHLNWRLLGARIIHINKYLSLDSLFNWTRQHGTHIWVPQNMKLVTFVYDDVYTLFRGFTSATLRRVATWNLGKPAVCYNSRPSSLVTWTQYTGSELVVRSGECWTSYLAKYIYMPVLFSRSCWFFYVLVCAFIQSCTYTP